MTNWVFVAMAFCCCLCILFSFYFHESNNPSLAVKPTDNKFIQILFDLPSRYAISPASPQAIKLFLPASDDPMPGSVFETQSICDGGSCCDGVYINRSCSWTNLYFEKKNFYAFVVNSSNISYESHAVSSGIRMFPQQIHAHPVFSPSVKIFESEEALDAAASKFQPMTQHERGLHLILSGGGHGNPAHAILDEVYSLWLCVCKFKLDNISRFVAMSLDTGLSGDPVLVEVSRKFFGDMVFIKHWDPSAAYRFDRVLAGVGQMGLSTPGSDYVTPGRSLDALKKLRNRFYRVYGHPPPIVRASSRRPDPLFVLIVPNKRGSNGVLSPDMVPLLTAAGYEAAYLDFGQLSYGERLPIFRRTDIMVTGVGTGATNGVFMSDGAVMVNLGTTERSGSLSFQEEYFFAAMYWTRVVYPTYDQFRGMSPKVGMELVHAARKLIFDDFDSSPGSSGLDNLSPIGKAAAEYFAHDAKAWGSFVGSYFPGEHFDLGCLNMAERLLCETGPWGDNRCAYTDRDLVLRLREKHGVCCSCS